MTRILNDIGEIAIWTSSVGILIWVVQYTALARWYKDTIGVTLVGEALAILLIYIPSLMAAADPAAFASFATTNWYHWLAAGIVIATAIFIITRIVVWERIRRRRNGTLRTSGLAARVAELEAENARLREQGGQA